ncbi:MAG: zinc-binding dehydrogenase [Chloroflexota bacterium]|nr:zinc-binding dehydrogenase [Chloroflexota bacterium]
MQGMLFLGDKQVALREFPAPSGPTGRQVVLKMRAAGLCGSDLRPYRSTLEGLGPRAHVIGGHEPCGEVYEVGPEVRNLRVGDRVMVHHYSGCGRCEHCLSGWSQLCPNGMTLYGSQAHGAMADYQLVEEHMCVPMPDGLSFAEGAACSCGTGTAYQALRRLGVSGRDTFAVFGQGPVGLSATLFGAASGANVIAVDPIPERRALAMKLGASETVDPNEVDPIEVIKAATHGRGADATLDASGVADVRAQAVRSTRVWGRSCFVGEGGTVTFDATNDIIHRQVTLMGSWTFSTVVLEELGHYVVDRSIPLRDMITRTFTLDQVAEAFTDFEAGAAGKYVVTFD